MPLDNLLNEDHAETTERPLKRARPSEEEPLQDGLPEDAELLGARTGR